MIRFMVGMTMMRFMVEMTMMLLNHCDVTKLDLEAAELKQTMQKRVSI